MATSELKHRGVIAGAFGSCIKPITEVVMTVSTVVVSGAMIKAESSPDGAFVPSPVVQEIAINRNNEIKKANCNFMVNCYV